MMIKINRPNDPVAKMPKATNSAFSTEAKQGSKNQYPRNGHDAGMAADNIRAYKSGRQIDKDGRSGYTFDRDYRRVGGMSLYHFRCREPFNREGHTLNGTAASNSMTVYVINRSRSLNNRASRPIDRAANDDGRQHGGFDRRGYNHSKRGYAHGRRDTPNGRNAEANSRDSLLNDRRRDTNDRQRGANGRKASTHDRMLSTFNQRAGRNNQMPDNNGQTVRKHNLIRRRDEPERHKVERMQGCSRPERQNPQEGTRVIRRDFFDG